MYKTSSVSFTTKFDFRGAFTWLPLASVIFDHTGSEYIIHAMLLVQCAVRFIFDVCYKIDLHISRRCQCLVTVLYTLIGSCFHGFLQVVSSVTVLPYFRRIFARNLNQIHFSIPLLKALIINVGVFIQLTLIREGKYEDSNVKGQST